MSKQAFDKVMSQVPEDKKAMVYATCAAYGMDIDSPEWVPFVVTQLGLIALEKATVDLNQGIDQSIIQVMKALLTAKDAEIEKISAAGIAAQQNLDVFREKVKLAIDSYGVKAQSGLIAGVADAVEKQVIEIIGREVAKLVAAQLGVNAATVRVQRYRNVSLMHFAVVSMVAAVIGSILHPVVAHFF